MRERSRKQALYLLQARFTESLTVVFLRLKGYCIIKRNHRIQGVEVDILAYKNECWVVVEVKSRRGKEVDWENAVTHTQNKRLRKVVGNVAQQRQSSARLDIVLWQPYWPWVKHYQDI